MNGQEKIQKGPPPRSRTVESHGELRRAEGAAQVNMKGQVNSNEYVELQSVAAAWFGDVTIAGAAQNRSADAEASPCVRNSNMMVVLNSIEDIAPTLSYPTKDTDAVETQLKHEIVEGDAAACNEIGAVGWLSREVKKEMPVDRPREAIGAHLLFQVGADLEKSDARLSSIDSDLSEPEFPIDGELGLSKMRAEAAEAKAGHSTNAMDINLERELDNLKRRGENADSELALAKARSANLAREHQHAREQWEYHAHLKELQIFQLSDRVASLERELQATNKRNLQMQADMIRISEDQIIGQVLSQHASVPTLNDSTGFRGGPCKGPHETSSTESGKESEEEKEKGVEEEDEEEEERPASFDSRAPIIVRNTFVHYDDGAVERGLPRKLSDPCIYSNSRMSAKFQA